MNAAEIVRDCLRARAYESPSELDSLQLVELILDLEERAGISIDDGLIGTGVTLEEMIKVVADAITEKGGASNGSE